MVQALFGGLSTLLTFRLGARVHGRGAGLIAALLVATSWVLIAFDAELLIPTLFVPLTLLALDRALAWGFDDRPGPALIGLAFGVAAIARPNVLLFMPVAFLIAIVKGRAGRCPLWPTLSLPGRRARDHPQRHGRRPGPRRHAGRREPLDREQPGE